MAYDRYESRRGWREPRSRFAGDYGESRGLDRDEREDRGCLDRADMLFVRADHLHMLAHLAQQPALG